MGIYLPSVEFLHGIWPLCFEKSHEMSKYPLPYAEVELVHQVGREHLIKVEVGINLGETDGKGALREVIREKEAHIAQHAHTCIGVSDLLSRTRLSRWLVTLYPLVNSQSRVFCTELRKAALSTRLRVRRRRRSGSVPACDISSLVTRQRGHGHFPRFLMAVSSTLDKSSQRCVNGHVRYVLLRVVRGIGEQAREQATEDSISTL